MLEFMSTTTDRWIRGAVGAALLITGVSLGGAAWALVAFGALLLGTGAADVCPISPLVGKPVRGCDIRADR